MKRYFKNRKLLERNNIYSKDMEHDACGVGLVASTEGKKSRKVVEYLSLIHISEPTRRM